MSNLLNLEHFDHVEHFQTPNTPPFIHMCNVELDYLVILVHLGDVPHSFVGASRIVERVGVALANVDLEFSRCSFVPARREVSV